MNKRTKLIQALLICLGYDNGGELNADGDWGENSIAAAQAYIVDESIEVAEGQDLQEVLLGTFQRDDFEFDLENADADDLKVTQAYLLSQGFDDDGKLIADGNPGPCTDAAAAVYLASLPPVETVMNLAAHDSAHGNFQPTFPPDEVAAAQTSAEA